MRNRTQIEVGGIAHIGAADHLVGRWSVSILELVPGAFIVSLECQMPKT